MSVLFSITSKIRLIKFRKKWRKNNQNNSTYVNTLFPEQNVKIGAGTYGPLNIISFGHANCSVNIGSYCSIANGVKLLLGGEHSYTGLTTFPFKDRILGEQIDTFNKGNIEIKDDVWIGEDAIILSGITVGQGALIGARSVIAKDIPPYAIVIGNPAKVIKYRCSKEKIRLLLECDFSRLSENMIKEHINDLYSNIEDANIDWIPKRPIKSDSE